MSKVAYLIVYREETQKCLRLKATFQNHFIELIYELKQFQTGFFWYGKIFIDDEIYWQSPESFGCDTRSILDDEIHHRLYTWALMKGYISHHNIAP